MQVPIHPMIVHFPMALSFIIPILVVIFAFMIKDHKMSPKGWLVIVALQMVVVATGYISLETGETEEHAVEKVVSKKIIHEHEESAEVFVGSTVLILALSIGVFFIRKEYGFPIKIGIAFLGLIACFLAYRTGVLGGELVYKHGAAAAYTDAENGSDAGLLPPLDMETISPETPDIENESLKVDENDYGNNEEVIESDDVEPEVEN